MQFWRTHFSEGPTELPNFSLQYLCHLPFLLLSLLATWPYNLNMGTGIAMAWLAPFCACSRFTGAHQAVLCKLHTLQGLLNLLRRIVLVIPAQHGGCLQEEKLTITRNKSVPSRLKTPRRSPTNLTETHASRRCWTASANKHETSILRQIITPA